MDFDLKVARECAEAFSVATGLGCCVSTPAGEMLYHCGNCCANCTICSVSGVDSHRCQSMQFNHICEAEHLEDKHIYYCAMGLTCFTSPILRSGQSVAQLTVGPFLMIDRQDYIDYELQYVLCVEHEAIERIKPMLETIPQVEACRVKAMSELLFFSTSFLSSIVETNCQNKRQEATFQQTKIKPYMQEKNVDLTLPYPLQTERALLKAISRGDAERAMLLLNTFLEQLGLSSGRDMLRIHRRTSELLAMMSRIAIERGLPQEAAFIILSDYYQIDFSKETLETLCVRLEISIRRMLEAVGSDRSETRNNLIQRTIHYIQLNYAQPVSFKRLAHSLSVSPGHLSRVFREKTTYTLTQFLTYTRIEKSKQLLETTNLSLAEIAQQCGFSDQSYYTNIFRKVIGMTPGAFRKKR